MAEIHNIKLNNDGGFVARIEVLWSYWEEERDAGGNVSRKNYTGTYKQDKDITVGYDKTVDLSKISVGNNKNLPDGASVKLKVFVVWGKDNTAKQEHIFRTGSKATAEYTITGTTQSNRLGEISVG